MLPTPKFGSTGRTCSVLVAILLVRSPFRPPLFGRVRGWTVAPLFLVPTTYAPVKYNCVSEGDTGYPFWSKLYDASCHDADFVPELHGSESQANQVAPRIQFRNATINDITLLLQWDEKEHLQGSWMGDVDFNDWNWEYELRRNDVSWRYQLIAETFVENDDSNEDENRTIPIGFVQVIDPFEEETHYWGIDCERHLRAIDIWIGDERYINRGYGTQMMKQILASAMVFGNTNVTGVIIDPMAENDAAHRFYQRLGFIPIGIRYFGPDKCLIHRMNRTDYVNKINPELGI